MANVLNQFRIAARVLLLNKDNKILLVANSKSKSWFTPGGRVEPDETLEAAAIRETYEETGLKVSDLKFVYVREAQDDNPEKPTHHICFYFYTKIEQENLDENWQDHDGYVDLIKFFSRKELQDLKVWPIILKDTFWTDLEEDFKNAAPYATYTLSV